MRNNALGQISVRSASIGRWNGKRCFQVKDMRVVRALDEVQSRCIHFVVIRHFILPIAEFTPPEDGLGQLLAGHIVWRQVRKVVPAFSSGKGVTLQIGI